MKKEIVIYTSSYNGKTYAALCSCGEGHAYCATQKILFIAPLENVPDVLDGHPEWKKTIFECLRKEEERSLGRKIKYERKARAAKQELDLIKLIIEKIQ